MYRNKDLLMVIENEVVIKEICKDNPEYSKNLIIKIVILIRMWFCIRMAFFSPFFRENRLAGIPKLPGAICMASPILILGIPNIFFGFS